MCQSALVHVWPLSGQRCQPRDANIAISRVQVLTQGDGDEYDVESVCGRERSLCVLRCHFSLVL
jgi:hypothetical protein